MVYIAGQRKNPEKPIPVISKEHGLQTDPLCYLKSRKIGYTLQSVPDFHKKEG